jgi:DNA-binding transcriptional MocR family regulator
MPLSECYFGQPTRQGFVLGYGGVEPRELTAAVRRLRALIRSA